MLGCWMNQVVYKATGLLALTISSSKPAVQLTASCFYHQLQRTKQLTIPRCNRSAHRSPDDFFRPLFNSRTFLNPPNHVDGMLNPLALHYSVTSIPSRPPLPASLKHRTASAYNLFLQSILS